MSSADQDLEPVSDKKIVERYLQYALEFREPISCLMRQDTLSFEATAVAFASKSLSLELEIPTESFVTLSPEDTLGLTTQGTEIRLSFSVNGVLYFAHGRIQSLKMRTLSLIVDLPVFKLQRRDAMRIKLLDEHSATITIDGKAYIPHDLSATGLSFVIMPNEEAAFPIRRMIQSCRLKFVGMDVLVNIEVTSLSRLRKENERLIKVGFRFMGLSPAVEQKLAREAYLHTHKIWSRWL